MDMKRLNHLLALDDERHFARAAERVHLSQPAFSRSIQWLEQEFGMQLFDRQAGEVKPTPAGTFVIARARRLMFDARSLRRDIALYRDSQLGDTAFGAGPVATASLMPRVVAELRRAHPGVNLRMETGNWTLLRERLLAEDIEFYIGEARDLTDDGRVVYTPLARQQGGLFVRAGHPLAGHSCSLAQAWQFGLVSSRLPREIAAKVAQVLGRPPGAGSVLAFECNDMALLSGLAQSTDTILGTTGAAVRHELSAGTLVALEVTDMPPVHVELVVMVLANRSLSPMARKAVESVEAIAAEVASLATDKAAPLNARKRKR